MPFIRIRTIEVPRQDPHTNSSEKQQSHKHEELEFPRGGCGGMGERGEEGFRSINSQLQSE